MSCSLPEHDSSESSTDVKVTDTEYVREVDSYGSSVHGTQTELGTRMRELESYLMNNFSRNSDDREKLIGCGYSARFWENVRENPLLTSALCFQLYLCRSPSCICIYTDHICYIYIEALT